MEALDDLAVHHARRTDLHDAARLDVLVCGLEIECHVARKRRHVAGVEQLQGFEDCQGIRLDHERLSGCVNPGLPARG